MRVRSLGQEDLLEEGMATHSSILAWRISWTEEPGRSQSIGLQRAGHDEATQHSTAQDSATGCLSIKTDEEANMVRRHLNDKQSVSQGELRVRDWARLPFAGGSSLKTLGRSSCSDNGNSSTGSGTNPGAAREDQKTVNTSVILTPWSHASATRNFYLVLAVGCHSLVCKIQFLLRNQSLQKRQTFTPPGLDSFHILWPGTIV